jgi:general secretion pathway protein L
LSRAAPVLNLAAAFLRWWAGELVRLVPSRLKAHRWPGSEFVEILATKDGLKLPPAGPDQSLGEEQPRGTPHPAEPRIAASGRRAGARLLLDEALFLAREAQVPAAGIGRADEILAFELERLTPFRRDQIFQGWAVSSGQPTGAHVPIVQAIVKRETLARLLQELRALGFRKIRVACRLVDGREIPIALPPELAVARTRAERFLRRANMLSAGVMGAAVVCSIYLAFARQIGTIASLDQRIAVTQAQAVAVRDRYDKAQAAAEDMATLLNRRTARPPVRAILEEISRVLPDTAWLTELRVERSAVTISGFAQSAPELIALLDRSSMFSEAGFAAPVVRSPREKADRFIISLSVPGAEPGPRVAEAFQ